MSNLGIILVMALLILATGGLPRWGYHRHGYAPSGLFGTILLIVLVLALMGRL